MHILLLIFLLILNLGLGFANIAIDASPYVIAINFFAAGFVSMAVVETARD